MFVSSLKQAKLISSKNTTPSEFFNVKNFAQRGIFHSIVSFPSLKFGNPLISLLSYSLNLSSIKTKYFSGYSNTCCFSFFVILFHSINFLALSFAISFVVSLTQKDFPIPKAP